MIRRLLWPAARSSRLTIFLILDCISFTRGKETSDWSRARVISFKHSFKAFSSIIVTLLICCIARLIRPPSSAKTIFAALRIQQRDQAIQEAYRRKRIRFGELGFWSQRSFGRDWEIEEVAILIRGSWFLIPISLNRSGLESEENQNIWALRSSTSPMGHIPYIITYIYKLKERICLH